MNANRIWAAALLLAATPAAAQLREESISPLLQQAMPESVGKQFTAVVVTFPPGVRAVPHRHGNAFLYAYVLEGSVRSHLEGQPIRTYHRGESWIELPGAHHLLTENVSTTHPARLLVTFVSRAGEPLKVPDQP
jgi:quercetin dioxygenase-like cupin family protein